MHGARSTIGVSALLTAIGCGETMDGRAVVMDGELEAAAGIVAEAPSEERLVGEDLSDVPVVAADPDDDPFETCSSCGCWKP